MLVPQECDLYQECIDSEMDTLHRDPLCDRLIEGHHSFAALQTDAVVCVVGKTLKSSEVCLSSLVAWFKAKDCVLAFSECVILVSFSFVSIQFALGHRAVRAQSRACRNRTNTSSLESVTTKIDIHSQSMESGSERHHWWRRKFYSLQRARCGTSPEPFGRLGK